MKRFNIRVYGLIIKKEDMAVLVSEEWIAGTRVIKFPGGGMELGEGTIECLKREFREELNAEIEIGDHFYTTDFYQKSAWDDSQVVSIYYAVQLRDPIIFPFDNQKEKYFYYPIRDLAQVINLPIDLVVAQQLKERYAVEEN